MIVEVVDSQTQLPLAADIVVRGHGNETLGIGRSDDFTGQKEFIFKSDVLKNNWLSQVQIRHDDYHQVVMKNVKLNQNLRVALIPTDIDDRVSSFGVNTQPESEDQQEQSKWMVNPFKAIARRIKKFFS